MTAAKLEFRRGFRRNSGLYVHRLIGALAPAMRCCGRLGLAWIGSFAALLSASDSGQQRPYDRFGKLQAFTEIHRIADDIDLRELAL